MQVPLAYLTLFCASTEAWLLCRGLFRSEDAQYAVLEPSAGQMQRLLSRGPLM
jgi:hypothetical protein